MGGGKGKPPPPSPPDTERAENVNTALPRTMKSSSRASIRLAKCVSFMISSVVVDRTGGAYHNPCQLDFRRTLLAYSALRSSCCLIELLETNEVVVHASQASLSVYYSRDFAPMEAVGALTSKFPEEILRDFVHHVATLVAGHEIACETVC